MPIQASHETRAAELLDSLEINGPFIIERLSGGLSGSEVIKVSTPHKAYVIRFWNMQWADYFTQDLACQLIASEAGYGPKVYYSDEVEGITVMEYHLPEILPEIHIRLKALVNLLKKIHKGPMVPKGIDRAVYFDLLIKENKESNFVDLEALGIIKDAIFASLRPYATYVPCHRDLHHGNLIYTHGCYFAIDYTWGGMDDPYADLANIAIFNCKNLEEEKLLLQLYLGYIPSLNQMARLSLMKQLAKIFYGLEFLESASSSKIKLPLAPQALTKSYMNFGVHGSTIPNPSDFLNYAISLLSEVFSYTVSEQYIQDLERVSNASESYIPAHEYAG